MANIKYFSSIFLNDKSHNYGNNIKEADDKKLYNKLDYNIEVIGKNSQNVLGYWNKNSLDINYNNASKDDLFILNNNNERIINSKYKQYYENLEYNKNINIYKDCINNEKKVINNNTKKSLYTDKIINWPVKTFIPIITLEKNINYKYSFPLFEYNLKNLKDNNNTFYDKLFEPKNESILGYNENKKFEDYFNQLSFLKASNIFKSCSIISDNIMPNDIIQGGLGDCYLLSTLAAIAEYPERLKNIICLKGGENGLYAITLTINGIKQEVLLDEYFPINPISKTPCFASTTEEELWVMLIEKAYAKVHGGYSNIISGNSRDAMREILGAPTATYFTEDINLFNEINNSDDNKYIMTASTKDLNLSGVDEIHKDTGLVGCHAYSLIDVIELIEYSKGKFKILKETNYNDITNIIRLVKLRNPWGKGEWIGKWSDNSKIWNNKELSALLNHNKVNDGIFYMEYNDFIKYFYDVQICYYNDNNKYSYITFENYNKLYLSLDIDKDGEYFISFYQNLQKYYPKEMGYEYSPITICLFYLDNDNNLNYIDAIQKKDKEIWFKKQLKRGKYYLYIEANWISISNMLTISSYGPEYTMFNKLESNNFPLNWLQRFIKSYININNDELKYFSEHNEPNIKYLFNHSEIGYSFFYFENNSKNNIFNYNIDLKETTNIQLIDNINLKKKLKLNPNENKLIIFKNTDIPSTISYTIIPSFEKDIKSLISETKQKGTVLKRYYNNEDIGIKCILHYHNQGLIILYQNNTDNYYISEKIKLVLDNCFIESISDNIVEVYLEPRKEVIINIIKYENNSNFNAYIDECDYEILKK